MSKNIEREEKALLNKIEYDALIKRFTNENNKIYSQINYYLSEIGIDPKEYQKAIRIRIEKGIITATLKEDIPDGKLEINQILSKVEFNNFIDKNNFPNGEVKEYLKKENIDANKLYVFAILSNYRLDINYKSTLISIDKSEYFNNIDYEIECEANSLIEAKNTLKEFLKNNDILYRENNKSKLKRVKDII